VDGAAAGAPRAVEAQVFKRFSSQAAPHWLKLRDRNGHVVDCVMKVGDDLRQDQLVLGMLQYFNELWKKEGCAHTALGVRPHSPSPSLFRPRQLSSSDGG
jgi:hypothetical protein